MLASVRIRIVWGILEFRLQLPELSHDAGLYRVSSKELDPSGWILERLTAILISQQLMLNERRVGASRLDKVEKLVKL